MLMGYPKPNVCLYNLPLPLPTSALGQVKPNQSIVEPVIINVV